MVKCEMQLNTENPNGAHLPSVRKVKIVVGWGDTIAVNLSPEGPPVPERAGLNLNSRERNSR